MTPRVEAALAAMSFDELKQIENAASSNNSRFIMNLLGAKDVAILFENDPLIRNMYREDLTWGDYILNNPQEEFSDFSDYEEADPDAKWVMPVLRLRKQIWENFPVIVDRIESKDKRERYVIRWHRKNFQQMRNDACEHVNDFIDYEDNTYRRLITALEASRFWTVEALGNLGNDLAIISMNFEDKTVEDDAKSTVSTSTTVSEGWETVPIKTTTATTATTATKTTVTTGPVLRRLTDMKNHFPVIWNEVKGCKSTTYAVEIFGKKVKELGLNPNTVKTDLLAALKASRAWTVLPPTDTRYVCLLQMNHL